MYINPSFGKVGQRLKDIRKKYDWTLQDACNRVIEISKQLSKDNPRYKEVKLNPSHLSKIENDEVDTSDYYIGLLCEAYEIKISSLYKNEDEFDDQIKNHLIHLPPHIRDFVTDPQNGYMLNFAYNLNELSDSEKDAVRKFLRIFNF